jgi:ABC-type lipoprotein export system ATPase subunit
MAMIVATGLRKTYRGSGTDVHALDGVDLSVRQGEFVAVMGPSGSGKSTLLHVLGALDVPDEGEVSLDGRSLLGLAPDELAEVRRRRVGFVFQLFNLVPVLTVAENIELPAALDGAKDDVRDERVSRLIDQLGLAGRRDLLPSQISGGEQQRAAIARALVNEPAVILGDEPTGNLDRASGRDVMDRFAGMSDAGQTIIIVTHDPSVASYARRVVFMQDGRLVDEVAPARRGSTSAILARLTELENV